MNRLKFSIKIKAPREKVWNMLWNDNTYRMWTSFFTAGSHAVTDWNEGSKVLFLSLSGSGMYSTIIKNIPCEEMSFKHLGLIKNGTEQPIDDKTKEWSGALESYHLEEANEETDLKVELDVTKDYLQFFGATFPMALEKVKELSEKYKQQN